MEKFTKYAGMTFLVFLILGLFDSHTTASVVLIAAGLIAHFLNKIAESVNALAKAVSNQSMNINQQ